MSKNNLISIAVKCGEYTACMDVPSDFFENNSSLVANTLKECLNPFINNEIIKNEENNVSKIPKEERKIQPPKRDEFKVRDRLPNNVVDIKDLNIKQAVTEQALVRCPKCGQSHVLAMKSGNCIYIMRKFYSYTKGNDEFRNILELDSTQTDELFSMSCTPDTDKRAYFEDIQNVPMIDDKDFTVTNDTEIFCPVCCESDTFLNWKDAYENPLEYFETEHLCDACGGETITKMIKKNKVNKCEKCGHETPYKEN